MPADVKVRGARRSGLAHWVPGMAHQGGRPATGRWRAVHATQPPLPVSACRPGHTVACAAAPGAARCHPWRSPLLLAATATYTTVTACPAPPCPTLCVQEWLGLGPVDPTALWLLLLSLGACTLSKEQGRLSSAALAEPAGGAQLAGALWQPLTLAHQPHWRALDWARFLFYRRGEGWCGGRAGRGVKATAHPRLRESALLCSFSCLRPEVNTSVLELSLSCPSQCLSA